MRTPLIVVLASVLAGGALASDQCEVPLGLPFATQLDRPVGYYNRASERVATAGALTPEDIATLWGMGLDIVVDVRPAEPAEVATERELVEAQGLTYYHLPYTDEGVAAADLATLNALLADPKEYRILIHCQRGNRAGAMLASHYLSVGAGREFALAAGRAAGLGPQTEQALLARLEAP